MHIDRARIDKNVAPPDPVEQLFPAPDAAGSFHEGAQQTKLGGAKLQRRPRPLHPVGFGIERDIVVAQHRTDDGRDRRNCARARAMSSTTE